MSELRIIIEKGNEYQAKSENIYRKDAFFRDAYRMAKECTKEILYADQIFDDPYEENKLCSDAELNAALLGYSNNLIAFCANRGHGKTSTMLSFAQALRENKKESNQDSQFYYTKEEFWQETDVMNCHFEVIDCIDPTTMESRDSILNVILSRMFNRFQEAWEGKYEQGRYRNSSGLRDLEREKDKLARTFQKCYHSLQILKSEKTVEEDDELEQIMGLGDSSNMRGMIYRLVREYLNFVGKEKNSYLILQIDDADLNIEKAYNIIEDIRKYLVMPKVIVLLAVNITQLESIVEQYFISQYLTSIKNGGMVDVERCHEIAERYIDKVIPGQRQIYLPNLGHALTDGYESITVSYIEKTKDGKEIDLLKRAEGQENWDYQDQLLHLIRQKTGLILIKPETFLHNILPGSMRELTHFLLYFGSMEKLSVGYKDIVNIFVNHSMEGQEKQIYLWKTNLQKFQHYLIELWSAVNLRETGRSLLKSLSREPLDNKNRHLLKVLPDYYRHERKEMGVIRGISAVDDKEYRQQFIEKCENRGTFISDISETYEYASYADIYTALSVLGELPGWNRQYKFIYAVRLYYSIQMHLLLIEQMEENKKELLVKFIKDVLYRKAGSNRFPANLPYVKFDLDGKRLRELSKNTGYEAQQNNAWVRHFCRKEILEGRSYRTIPIQIESGEEWNGDNEKLVFNLFYPFLYELDLLYWGRNLERESYQKESVNVHMIVALAVMLNCDVQYTLGHNLKVENTEAYLPECIKSIYGTEKISDVLKKAEIEEDIIEKFKTIYNDMENYKKIMLAIQLSCEDMGDETSSYYHEIMKNINNSYDELKEEWGSDEESKKINDKLKEKPSEKMRKACTAISDELSKITEVLNLIKKEMSSEQELNEQSLRQLGDRIATLNNEIDENFDNVE